MSEPASGQERAILEATLPHVDVIYRIARQATGDHAGAEDLVQETYLRAFASFGQHRTPHTRAWLATICLNLARSQTRQRAHRVREIPMADPDDLRVAWDDVSDRALANVERDTIEQCLARLPAPQRRSIVLMDLGGFTARETAQMMGCPRGTVLARVHRGRRRLAQLLVEAGVDRGAGDGRA